jgi:hypothetical protein
MCEMTRGIGLWRLGVGSGNGLEALFAVFILICDYSRPASLRGWLVYAILEVRTATLRTQMGLNKGIGD